MAEAFGFWRANGFPFPRVRPLDMTWTFKRLATIDGSCLDKVLRRPSTVGLKVANAFSPAIWMGRVRGKSPLECFEDDPTFFRGMERAPVMWPSRPCWNAAAIRTLTGLLNHGRLSNFRPTVACAIIGRYSGAAARVIDFSAGYGGRLLGALSLDRHYIGIEPAALQAGGLRYLISQTSRWSRGSAEIMEASAEDVLPALAAASADLIFTSPPYYNHEKYARDDSQSWVRYDSFPKWVDGFARVAIEQSHRLLRRGGLMVLNIANTRRHPVADTLAELAAAIFGPAVARHDLLLSTNPNLKGRGQLTIREGIWVWRKR